MNLLDRFRQWMIGRYGMDQLGWALAIVYMVLSVTTSFTHNRALAAISYLPFLLCLYRMFSKNINRRYQENQTFLAFLNPFKNRYQFLKHSFTERKTYRFFICKQCGQTIRVPKGKGKIEITCPKCRNKFIKKT